MSENSLESAIAKIVSEPENGKYLTFEDLIKLEKIVLGSGLVIRPPCFVATKDIYLAMREKGFCENFTDEELQNAEKSGNGFLKVMRITGYRRNVRCYLEQKYSLRTPYFIV